ncbi:MAG: DUF4430 domain-containing protein [Clostridia bacterium]|nr:DUF4430 domain-containing protein [Clostridia bacterium]
MKHVKKLLAVILAFALVTAALPMAVFAGAQHQMTVTLRIEGVSQNYYYETLTVQYSSANLTVQDLIIYADNNSDAITVVGATGSNPYITDINGDVAGTLGAYSGWLYTVNGEEPPVGVNGYNLSEGDNVVLYFGDPYGVGMQYPVADTDDIDSGVIRFVSNDTTYGEDWTPVVTTNPVVGMTVVIGEATFTTDEEGKIVFDNELLPAGKYAISIDKKAESGLPLVLRFAPDAEIEIPELPAATSEMTVKLRIEGINSNLFYDDVTVAYTGEQLSVQDFIIYADEHSDALTVIGAEGASPYISSINGDAAGTFGGWDGWLYTVNGEEPGVGINETFLKEGDEILFYFGDPYGVGMQYPEIDITDINKHIIRFVSNDTTYGEDWSPVVTTNPVVGMTVLFDGHEFVTDENGEIKLSRDLLTAVAHTVAIDKKAENGLPLVLRFAPDFTVEFPEVRDMIGDMDYDHEITVSDALAVLRIAAKLVPVTDEALAICDMDNDGEITVADALYVLRIAAKLIPAPGGEEPGTEYLDAGQSGVMHGDII